MVRIASALLSFLPLLSAVSALVAPTHEASDLAKRQRNTNFGLCNADWQSATRYYYIFFQSPGNSSIIYEYSTQWYLKYPDVLRKGLRAKGLEVLDTNPLGTCGWTLIDKVSKTGIPRAWIEYQSVDGYFVPANQTVVRLAREVLLETFPTFEYALFGGIIGGLLVLGLLGFTLFCCCATGFCGLCGLCSRRSRKNKDVQPETPMEENPNAPAYSPNYETK